MSNVSLSGTPFSPLRRRLLRAGLTLAAALPLAGFRSLESFFAPAADLWPRWQASDESSPKSIDFTAWNAFLQRYTRQSERGLTLVAYAAVTAADHEALKAFVSAMADVQISRYARRVQLPYWVNLYNAITVDVVLDHYPVDSIRDIDIAPGLFTNGPWDKALIAVEGEALTLNDIEHRILRPIWRDPRLHYVVNCASVGCPNLRTEAYRPETMEQLLGEAAHDYVNDPRGVTIRDGRVRVSSIYDWFIEDFGGNEAGVLAHLLRYAEPALAERLAAIGELHESHYDWRLNDAAAVSAG